MKKIQIVILVSVIIFGLVGCNQQGKKLLEGQPEGLYAALKVNGETMLINLHYQEVPLTVTNFVGLATGKFSEHVPREDNFYDGIVFHRVVEGFVIQSGDPEGNGKGGPGYSFPDEFVDSLKHDGAGILSMANSGPDTNGSQFFITINAQPSLNGRHSVFGKVVEGTELIETVQQNDTIDSIRVYAKGSDAQQFLKNVSWDGFQALIKKTTEERERKIVEKKEESFEKLNNSAMQKTPDNVFYEVLTPGRGRQIRKGDVVDVHYELKLYGEDELLDSSYSRNQPFTLEVGANSVIKGWELILLEMREGEKIQAIIPPELAYGTRGVVGVIPPESFLDFTMEVIDIK